MKHILFWLLFLAPFSIFSQVEAYGGSEGTSTMPISISYYGNLMSHPGIKLGMERGIYFLSKTKGRSESPKTIHKLLFVAPSVAFYVHPGSHSGLLPAVDIGWRRYSPKLFFREFSVGLGYFRKFNAGETWEVNDAGNAEYIGGTSRGYFAPSVSLATGKAFSLSGNGSLAVFLKANTNFVTGYSAGIVFEYSAEIGVRVVPGFGFRQGKMSIKTKNNTR